MWRLLLFFSLLGLSCKRPGNSSKVFHLQADKKSHWLEHQHQQGFLEAACNDSVRIRGIWQHRCTRGIGYVPDSIFVDGALELACWQTYPAQFEPGMSLPDIDLLCRKAVQDANSLGYPFAQVTRTIKEPQSGRYHLEVVFRAGEQFYWDSLIFAGTPAPDAKWTMRALGLAVGSVWEPVSAETIKARMDMTAP
jgi:hypothetical protein